MKVLFIHQNMPGQFKHLAPDMAAEGHDVRFLTQRADINLPGVKRITYPRPNPPKAEAHPYLKLLESAVLTGQQVARVILAMKARGFAPDLVIAHPGWGEALFVKDVLPGVPLISFCEFFYRGHGADVGFDPEDGSDIDMICRQRVRAGHLLASLEACDAGVSPTHWQKSVHPKAFHDKIRVIFDGIDTETVRPEISAQFALPDGRILRPGDPIVTYVARNLEPYRGFRSCMRAVPRILALHKRAEIVILGGDEVSYGSKPKDHANWREAMLAEVAFDRARVHFLGKIPYPRYLELLRVSAAHIYLTYPFVLSWSCLEAMAMRAVVVASDTAPVSEVIRDGENGLLVDFFDPAGIAATVARVLENPQRFALLGSAARETIVADYDLQRARGRWKQLIADVCNPAYGMAREPGRTPL
jgi:glycosyltransferase involved in cell wall biosynthesis